ncbi:MAG TPA: F0F1 ATP synthase subunit delta [Acidimicrobiales bacterium]|nr:F0F1 ATP synthase subunit delta [Acidimicrobiales bacterium]
MHPRLRGYATAVVGEGARLDVGARLAADLDSVAHLVSRTNSLSMAVSDFAVPVAARRDLLADLLASRIHPLALRLVLWAVQTERADDLPTTLHDLYEFARHHNEMGPAELRAEEPKLSRTGWREFASGYGGAVFEDQSIEEIEEIEDELFRFTRIVEASPQLRSALSDPARTAEERLTLLQGLLSGKVRPATMQLAAVLFQGHVRDVVSALDWLVEQAAQARGWRVARVRTARPIDADERRSLAQAMEHLTNRPVELQVTDDPSLLGGAVIQIGDLLVDASARHRLDQLQEHLLGTEGTTRGAHT